MIQTPNSPKLPNDGQAKCPIEYGERVTPEDRSVLDVIHRELASPAPSADRREELEWVLAGYADKYCFDWLWEDPALKDHPDNPLRK